jgi:hypothetical protein
MFGQEVKRPNIAVGPAGVENLELPVGFGQYAVYYLEEYRSSPRPMTHVLFIAPRLLS